jgi:hypothetical protein
MTDWGESLITDMDKLDGGTVNVKHKTEMDLLKLLEANCSKAR